MSKDKPYYFNVQEILIDKGYWAIMGDIARSLYIVLCRYQDWKTRICWPSNAELCEATGKCLASVIKASKNLKELGLIDTWYFREKGERYHKKFYRIKPIEDLLPLAMDISTTPLRMDISTRKRDKKGRFLKNDSIGNGTPPSIGNGTTPSIGNGHKLILMNESQGTNLKEKSLSFMDMEKQKEGIRELIKAIGKERTRQELSRCGRDPNLVNEIEP